MKRIFLFAIITLFVCLSIYGCDDASVEENASHAFGEQHISDYMAEHPYFNPHNMLTDCDDKYIYCVQSHSETAKAGIYRRLINGEIWELIYHNDETPVVGISEDGEKGTPIIPAITSLAVHRENLYFAKLGHIYCIKTDGSGFVQTEYDTIPDRPYPYILKIIDNILYAGTDDKYVSFDLTEDPNLNVICETDAVNHINTGVQPWSSLLPEDWILSKDYSLTLTTPVGESLAIDPEYSPLLIDCQNLTAISVSTSFIDAEEDSVKYYSSNTIQQISLDDLHTEKSTFCIQTEADNPNNPSDAQWRNSSNGTLYGYLNHSLYAYNISTGNITKTDLPDGLTMRDMHLPEIDVVDSLVFFRGSDRVVRCWDTADMSVCIVG